MSLRRLSLLLALMFAVPCCGQLPTVKDVRAIINKVNQHWQATTPSAQRQFWDNAVYHTANMAVFALTGDSAYYSYSLSWAEHNAWQGARGSDPAEWKYSYGESDDYVLFGDQQVCFQVYAALYAAAPEERKIARIKEVLDYQMSLPNVDYWWWVDALYMAMPVFAEMAKVTGEDRYCDKMHTYWHYTDSLLYDSTYHLYYRDERYLFPVHTTPSGAADFWARGNGWAIAALARVLAALPADDEHKAEYVARYTALAAALRECQHGDGYWCRCLLDEGYAPGPETSGTALITYALLWGINNGYLDRGDYEATVLRAWHYLTTTALLADGTVGYVQPIGSDAAAQQTIAGTATAPYGVGAFLLAATEMERYLSSRGAYLFVYFTGNRPSQEQIHYAVSRDGYNYRQLNDGQPVLSSKEISSTGGVRDPHILRCEDDTTFYMVATDMVCGNGWDSNRAMVLLRSSDLLHWTHTVINIQETFKKQKRLKRVWAPQTIYDAAAGKYMVYWSMKHGKNGQDIIYYSYVDSTFTTLTTVPTPLFLPQDRKACIDGDIVYKDGIYHLFYKTEGHGNGIRVATTDCLTCGSWHESSDYKQQTEEDVEGAGTFKLIGEDKYILMYDVYKKHTYQFTESSDLSHFREIDNKMSMDFHPRHGTIIALTHDELHRLINYYGLPADLF